MTPAEITAALRAETVAKIDAAIVEVARRTAHLPEETRAAVLDQLRTALDAQLARLECQWAAFDRLLASRQLPADEPWRSLINLGTTRREPGETLQ